MKTTDYITEDFLQFFEEKGFSPVLATVCKMKVIIPLFLEKNYLSFKKLAFEANTFIFKMKNGKFF